MTTGRGRRTAAARVTAALLAACGTLALAACDQRAEPHPAYEAAPPPPPAPLAGDPNAAPSAPPPVAPSQPETPAPSLAPPDAALPPQVAPGYGEGLVAMAPIPNPEDGGPAPPRSTPAPLRSTTAAVAPRLHRAGRHRRHASVRPHPAPAAARPTTTAARPPAATVRRPHPAPAPAAAPKPHPPTAPAKPAVHSAPHHERRATPAELRQARRAAPPAGAKAASNTTAADADARTEALRSALSAAVARGAVLSAPKGGADGASEVTLTLPAGFYDTVKTEAGRQAMGDAAASANADATLTGEGYAIIPGGAQAQPLRVGQPTLFRWTVTAPSGAKGPLRADVSVDLLGGGSQTLALGAVDPASAPGGAPRWWGAALLAAVVAVGFWWMLRTRSADARIAASRKRARRPDGTVNGQRPLDLRPDDVPPPR